MDRNLFQEIEIVSHSSKSTAAKNLGDGNSSVSALSPSTPSEHINSPRMSTAQSSENKTLFSNYPSVPSPSARVVNNSQVNGAPLSSQNCTLSITDPNAMTSPFSPLNTNSNHHDQNSQSMSPRLSREQPTIPTTAPLSTVDSSASVGFHRPPSSLNRIDF